MTSDELLAAVVALYADSVKRERFNGVRLNQLSLDVGDDELRETIVALIRGRKLDCLAPPVLNPHIKRFPAPPPESQIELPWTKRAVRARAHSPSAATSLFLISLTVVSI
jgi:hypothetical protein